MDMILAGIQCSSIDDIIVVEKTFEEQLRN